MRRVVEYRHGKRVWRKAAFRAYHSLDQSVEDHAALLAEGRPYRKARLVAEDPVAYAQALKGSYASDPRYGEKLACMVEEYGFRRFDWSAQSPWQ